MKLNWTSEVEVLLSLLVAKANVTPGPEMLAILSRVEFLLAPQVLYTTRPDVRRGKLPKPSTMFFLQMVGAEVWQLTDWV